VLKCFAAYHQALDCVDHGTTVLVQIEDKASGSSSPVPNAITLTLTFRHRLLLKC
jgi:hypothetical protein